MSEPVQVTDVAPLDVADVALGAALSTGIATYRLVGWGARFGLSAARTGYRTASAAARWVPPAVSEPIGRRVDRAARGVAEQGLATREQAPIMLAAAAAALLDRIVPWIVDNALDRIDLNQLVSQRVDIDGLAALLDLDAAVSRVDLEAIVGRLDLNAIVATVDLDAIVATVDLDAAVARVDVDAVVRTVDMAVIVEIARRVVDEIDLPLIIRESSGGVAADLVTDVRLQTIDADQAFGRFLDRVLRRGSPPSPAGDSAAGAVT